MGGGLGVIGMFKAGGWVMYPILILSIVMMTVTLERLIVIFLEKRKMKPAMFMKLFEDALEQNGGDKIKAVDTVAEALEKKGGVMAEILLAGIHKFKDGIAKGLSSVEIKRWMKEGIEEQANISLPTLDAHLVALAVIANVSTLMGLFGTVIGMIESFTAMANSPGGVKADEMAGGIAIALVATAFGLTVAVPSLILYNYIKSNTENYVLAIEECAMRTTDTLAE